MGFPSELLIRTNEIESENGRLDDLVGCNLLCDALSAPGYLANMIDTGAWRGRSREWTGELREHEDGTKNADQHGSAFSLFILGGPGRNRTTDKGFSIIGGGMILVIVVFVFVVVRVVLNKVQFACQFINVSVGLSEFFL